MSLVQLNQQGVQAFNLEELKTQVRDADENTKLLLEDNTVQYKNAFTSRLPGTYEARMAATNAFFQALRDEYGEGIVDSLKKDAQVAQLFEGKPLSVRRIKAVIEMAEAKVTEVMNSVASALRSAKGEDFDAIRNVDPKAYQDYVDKLTQMKTDVHNLLTRRSVSLPVGDFDRFSTELKDLPPSYRFFLGEALERMVSDIGVKLQPSMREALANSFYLDIKSAITKLPQETMSVEQFQTYALSQRTTFNRCLLSKQLQEVYSRGAEYMDLRLLIKGIEVEDPNFAAELESADTPERFQNLLQRTQEKMMAYQSKMGQALAQFEKDWDAALKQFAEKNSLDVEFCKEKCSNYSRYKDLRFTSSSNFSLSNSPVESGFAKKDIDRLIERMQTNLDNIRQLSVSKECAENFLKDVFNRNVIADEIFDMAKVIVEHEDLRPGSEHSLAIQQQIQQFQQSRSPAQMHALIKALTVILTPTFDAAREAVGLDFIEGTGYGEDEKDALGALLSDKLMALLAKDSVSGMTHLSKEMLRALPHEMLGELSEDERMVYDSLSDVYSLLPDAPLTSQNIADGLALAVNIYLSTPLTNEEEQLLNAQLVEAAAFIEQGVQNQQISADMGQDELRRIQQEFINDKIALLRTFTDTAQNQDIPQDVRRILLTRSTLSAQGIEVSVRVGLEQELDEWKQQLQNHQGDDEKFESTLHDFFRSFMGALKVSLHDNLGLEVMPADDFDAYSQIALRLLMDSDDELSEAFGQVGKETYEQWRQSFLTGENGGQPMDQQRVGQVNPGAVEENINRQATSEELAADMMGGLTLPKSYQDTLDMLLHDPLEQVGLLKPGMLDRNGHLVLSKVPGTQALLQGIQTRLANRGGDPIALEEFAGIVRDEAQAFVQSRIRSHVESILENPLDQGLRIIQDFTSDYHIRFFERSNSIDGIPNAQAIVASLVDKHGTALMAVSNDAMCRLFVEEAKAHYKQVLADRLGENLFHSNDAGTMQARLISNTLNAMRAEFFQDETLSDQTLQEQLLVLVAMQYNGDPALLQADMKAAFQHALEQNPNANPLRLFSSQIAKTLRAAHFATLLRANFPSKTRAQLNQAMQIDDVQHAILAAATADDMRMMFNAIRGAIAEAVR